MRLEGTGNGRRNANRLRKEMTPPEIALWLALRRNEAGLRFRKQYAAADYVLDFYCAPARLAIEVDGEAHSRGHRPMRDAIRDEWLAAQGVRVALSGCRRDIEPGGRRPRNHDGRARQVAHIREVTASSPSVRLRLPPPPGGGGLSVCKSS
jgi:very-short-patch-repair endonuclease